MTRWRVAGVGVALLALVGCSALPMQPILPREAGLLSGGVTRAALLASTDTTGQGSGGQLPVLYPVGTVTDSLGTGQVVPVVGKDGGIIDLWGMTLRIPANAIAGDASVTMWLLDPAKHECQLEINPPTLNHFNTPVTLQFDVPEAPDLRVLSVYWWDPVGGVWVPVDSQIDTTAKTISAQLQHFSKYKVDTELLGKAGW